MCGKIKSLLNKKKNRSLYPHPDDFDKNNSKLAVGEKHSIVTLFRKGNVKHNKDGIHKGLDRYSLLSGIKNNQLIDFKERSMLDIYSKLQGSKEKLSKLFHAYLAKNKDSKLLRYISATVLKKKFSLTKSKQNILNQMIKDYREGKIHLSDFNKGSQIDFTTLDKDRFHKILREYENKRKLQDKEFLKNLNINDIKKKFPVSGSQQGIFKMLVDDYKKGKLNDAFLKKLSKIDLKNINQERFQKVLQDYQNSRKKVDFVRESKLEQVRSFVKSKIAKV